jgi:amino acid transporter
MDLLKKLAIGLLIIVVYLTMAVGLIVAVTYAAGTAAELLGIELLIQKPELIYEAASVCGFIFLIVVFLDYRRAGRSQNGNNPQTAIKVAFLLALGIVVLAVVGLGIARLLMTFADPMFSLYAGHFLAFALMLLSWAGLHKITRPVAS